MRRFQVLVIVTALFGLGIGGSFGSGVWYGRRNAPAAASASATATPGPGVGLSAAAAAGGGGGGFATTGGGATIGTVEEVTGDNFTVRTSAGGTVAIKLQPDTTLRSLTSAATTDIRPGVNVTVTGQVDVDNKVAARSVQISPPGATTGGPSRGSGTATAGTATRPAGAQGPGARPGAAATQAP